MSITTDVRSYADIALSQGKAALSSAGTAAVLVNKRLVADAPKPAYAALGAADLVATAVTRRVESLPTDAVSNVGRVQQTGRVLMVRTQNDALARLTELRGRLDSGLSSIGALPTVARSTTEAYLSTAKDLYGKLTARGEAKAAELRKDPRVSRLLGQAGEVAESVQGVAGSVQSTVSPVVKSAFDAVESTPARRTTTHRTTARKTTARKAPVSKAPVSKAPVSKAPVSKAPVSKAPTAKPTAARANTAKAP
ncbi:MAG TPA: hypothetical protein VH298_12505, partial [Jatrophihabitans sp.]|nr:hypothetical protein [Jatrophihabitans sp.]